MRKIEPHDYATPTLMRFARGVYAQAIRAELHAAGLEDLPGNGAFILAGIDGSGGPREDLPGDLGVSKQAVNQVIDTLVARGYVDRRTDPDDRRRILLDLTTRGQEAVLSTVRAVELIDGKLAEHVSGEEIDAMRSALAALANIKVDALSSGQSTRRPPRELRQFSPIFPVSDLKSALAHYESLGFKTFAYEDGDGYGFANRDRLGLHLGLEPEPLRPAAAYLYVRDADALHAEWSAPGIGGVTHPVFAAEWGLREGSHVDPDGNLIRFGSPIPGWEPKPRS